MLQIGLPYARANIAGGKDYPNLHGRVDFYPYKKGTLVIAELWGLPYSDEKCGENICALHIHQGGKCERGEGEDFLSALGHYNPEGCPHPAHAGDLPPLFVNRGYAWLGCYTERFTPNQVVGKTVIIHSMRDDFTTQPSGDAGIRIGCGVITT